MKTCCPLSRLITQLLSTMLILLTVAPSATAQQGETVHVTVRLRSSDGQPVRNEGLVLVPFGSNRTDGLSCETNAHGDCTWLVAGGLYELLTAHQLDPLSRLAVAESGLRGLGITVGTEPITYAFTLQPNRLIYFDMAADAPIPVPFIPADADIFRHNAPAALAATTAPSSTLPATSESSMTTVVSAENTSSINPSPILLYIFLGLILGSVTFLVPFIRHHYRKEQDNA